MGKRLTENQKEQIKKLRTKGWSLPEIQKDTGVGYGTVYRYIKDVQIDANYFSSWLGKRSGSIKRKIELEQIAKNQAEQVISTLSVKEKMIFLSTLYWGEGSKLDFGLSNTDPELIRVFVKGLQEVFGIQSSRFRISIRIYEDLNKEECLEFWQNITGMPRSNFVSVNILRGKKAGKLKYGMCRVRISKGGDLLKYLKAIQRRVSQIF